MTPLFKNKQELIEYLDNDGRVKYLFFWGDKNAHNQSVGKACFSQWYAASFEIDGIRYHTAEHYMMAEKARMFGDTNIRQQIIAVRHPGEAKKLGRLVSGFDQERWETHRVEIVVRGNVAKFGQNLELLDFFLNTKQRVLVEASPIDDIWGMGLPHPHKHAEEPGHWPGTNVLGFALMEAREILRNK